MAGTDTLEAVAELLPEDKQQRFFLVMSQLRELPDEDELMQVLEAIGFMTLLWREVPEQIKGILEGAKPPAETTQGVTGAVRQAVSETIPSYEDLKKITQRLESHELALKNTLVTAQTRQLDRSWPWVVVVFVFGILTGLIAHAHLLPLLP